MISAPYLEVAVVVLGTIILLVESFTSQLDRRFLGYAALFGLAMIFIATFFVAPQSSTASAPLWNFYSADALSLFFKRIRSEEHTSELQSRRDLVCRLLLEKKKNKK